MPIKVQEEYQIPNRQDKKRISPGHTITGMKQRKNIKSYKKKRPTHT